MLGLSMGASHRACTRLRVSRANGALFTACQGFLWAGKFDLGPEISRSVLGLARMAGASLRSLALTPPQPQPPRVQGDTFEG